jgi:beta-glucuronidase
LLVGRPWGDATVHADFIMMNEYFGTWHGPKDSLGPALDTIHLTWPEKVLIVSEFGFAPHWQQVEGPRTIDPAQYYQVPDDVCIDSLEADVQRQRVIREQMAIFRSKPFVSGAILWAYRGGMGVVDDCGNPRPSWQTLREEFAPIAITEAAFSFPDSDRCKVRVSLCTRGPVEEDLPAYTLWKYRLVWELRSRTGQALDQRGDAALPILPPGTAYDVPIDMLRPAPGSQLRVSVIRPNGFSVIDRQFASP